MEWFNAVDATYRSDLRELNELNFDRFEAKLDQRLAELRVEMQVGFARADAKFEECIRRLETRVVRWVLGVWIAQAATTVGLVFGVIKLLQ